MKKKFSAIISEEELSALESDVPAVENPQLLERAILNLITNLNNSTYDDDLESLRSESTIYDGKAPLELVAPNTVSIKPTVVKAVDIITKVRGVHVKNEPSSPEQQASPMSQNMYNSSIKSEPANILSPTSSYSVSSHDSDACISPRQNTSDNQTTLTLNRQQTGYGSASNEGQICTQQNYDHDSISIRNSSSDSFSSNYSNFATSSAPNNDSNALNNNNNFRCSVLKRTHNNDDDEYTDLIKKQVLNDDIIKVPQNPPIDLLASSSSGW